MTPCPKSGGKAWIASPTKKQRAAPTVAATVSTYCGLGNAPGSALAKASHASSDTTASGSCGNSERRNSRTSAPVAQRQISCVAGRMTFAVRGSSGSRDGRRPNLSRRVFGLVEREGTV